MNIEENRVDHDRMDMIVKNLPTQNMIKMRIVVTGTPLGVLVPNIGHHSLFHFI